MRFLAGGQSASTLRNRIFVVFVLIFFLYAYHSQQITYSAIISSQENVLESCEQQSAGLKARLKLIWDHKQMVEKKLEKMEQKSLRDEETSRKLREEIVPNLRTAATNCGVKLDDCQKSLNECQIRPAVPKEHVENDASIREELMKLKKRKWTI
ncbi:unnamed protein product [Caenorhabditis auriculariae]|uniref:Uncharacterized protein n=1 Tax=Caenorhabditis auriculariae TaxID=2777116 RepID=A0A8S1H3N4_9PELO|nr:unnamed protein product [Caenorhabditis auriculariae]